MKRVILLLVDGLRPDVAERMLAAGALPNLARMTGRRGVGRAVTTFPSTTNVAYLPFLTGCAPGRLNVPAIRWLDRADYGGRWWRERDALRSYCGYQAGRLDADLPADVRTIWELVPESAGIFTPVTRGLSPDGNRAGLARQFWGAVAHFIPQLHGFADRAVARRLLAAVEQPLRFVFAQFPAVDGYTHRWGPDSPRVHNAMRFIDDTVGEVLAALTRRGERDDTLLVMVSDHGAAPVHTHLDLADWFRGRGVPALSHPVMWQRDPRVAVAVSGNGHATIYARPGVPRADRWPLEMLRQPQAFGTDNDLVAELAAEEGVAFVAGEAGPGRIGVVSSDGYAEITRSRGRVSYRRCTGDPLKLGADRSASAQDWLAAYAVDPYPDAAVQLLDQFAASRTGDMVVAAREGWDLRRRFEFPEHKAGHGSLVRSHMLVPFWSSEPVPTTGMRTVDVFPAMLHWLGQAVPADLCGRSRWVPGAARLAVAA